MAPSWTFFQVGSDSDDHLGTPSLFVTPRRQPTNLISIIQLLQLVMNLTENHKSTRRSLYIIMIALWLLPADKHDA